MLETLAKQKTNSIKVALADLGGWPILNHAWCKDAIDLTDLIIMIRNNFGLDSLLTLSVSADKKNNTNNILTVLLFQ